MLRHVTEYLPDWALRMNTLPNDVARCHGVGEAGDWVEMSMNGDAGLAFEALVRHLVSEGKGPAWFQRHLGISYGDAADLCVRHGYKGHERQYAERNPRDLEPYFSLHMLAMTEENLVEKADIAIELAFRDKTNEKLRLALASVL